MAEGILSSTPTGREPAAYLEVLHTHMIVYSMSTAAWVHLIPQAALILVLIVRTVRIKVGVGYCVKCLLWGIVSAVLSLICSIALPGLMGAARVMATGEVQGTAALWVLRIVGLFGCCEVIVLRKRWQKVREFMNQRL